MSSAAGVIYGALRVKGSFIDLNTTDLVKLCLLWLDCIHWHAPYVQPY